jgi:hypothetical protein
MRLVSNWAAADRTDRPRARIIEYFIALLLSVCR